MSRVPYVSALLLLALAGAAEAQYPRSSGRTTSTVGTYFGDTTTAAPTPAPAPATGALRQLVCRGAEGLKVETVANPSPRNSNQVAVSLSYKRNPRPAGAAYEQLDPGTCSWNTTGDPNLPTEPGIVHFDLDPKGSEYYPDATTMTQWMNNSRHYWSFYVNDATNVSISFGAYGAQFRAPSETQTANTGAKRNERLRCRGGGGASFTQGQRKGPNLFAMILKYQPASSLPGPLGKGLQPGTCAWADRTNAPAEPGKVKFLTARNAQREQEQTGGVVDSSATAAERYPDLRTIPAYMTDPSHYWTFNVSLTNPDSALRHSAWLPTTPTAPDPQPPPPVATTPGAGDPYTSGSPSRARTSVSLPGGSTVGETYTPGSAATGASTPIAMEAPLRLVGVNTVLDGFTIQFSGRPNLTPTVLYSTEKPVREPSTGRWFFPGGVVQGSGAVEGGFRAEVSGGQADGFRASYSAWSRLAPARGTLYYYIITLPQSPDAKEEQLTGQFTTLAQRVRVVITQIGVSETSKENMSFRLFVKTEGSDALHHDIGSELEWQEGYHVLEGQVLEVPNAPDRLRVLVWGGDFSGVFGAQLMPQYEWDMPPKNNSTFDQNIARYELTIGGSKADRYITFPFILEPVYRATLMFTVHGRVEVIRE